MADHGENFDEIEADSLLGTTYKIRVPKLPEDEQRIIESNVEFRYRIQGIAREVLWDKDQRLNRCMRSRLSNAANVEIRRDPDSASAHYRNLYLCNRVWTCPVCSARISNARRHELSTVMAGAKLKGLYPVLVTYTLRHDGNDQLEPLLQGLLDALRMFKSGRAYQDIKAEYGIVGGIRALEMTFGENGWHPHVHELLFLDEHLSPQQCAGLRKWLIARWVDSLRKLEFDASYTHGIDVRTADSKIAEYIAKFGREPHEREWTVEHELTSAANKQAAHDGLTPFELLECYEIGDQQAGRLYREYAAAMDGKRQLVWSAGLRALLAMPEELSDIELPGFEETPNVYTAVELDAENWKKVCMIGLRGALLWLVAAGDWTTLTALFKRYSIDARVQTSPPPESVNEPVIKSPAAGSEINAKNILLFELPLDRRA